MSEGSKEDSESNFTIEKLVNIKKESNQIYIFIKWKGYSSNQNTWEPLKNLKSEYALKNLNEFKKIAKEKNIPLIDEAIQIWEKKLQQIKSPLNDDNLLHERNYGAIRDKNKMHTKTNVINKFTKRNSIEKQNKISNKNLFKNDEYKESMKNTSMDYKSVTLNISNSKYSNLSSESNLSSYVLNSKLNHTFENKEIISDNELIYLNSVDKNKSYNQTSKLLQENEDENKRTFMRMKELKNLIIGKKELRDEIIRHNIKQKELIKNS